MKSWHVLIASIVALGLTANLLAMGSVIVMMNASLVGLGVLGSYHLIKKARKNRFKAKTVNLGEGKTFWLAAKKDSAV